MKPKQRNRIAVDLQEVDPLVRLWQEQNPGTRLSYLVRKALLTELKPIAGKRYAHLYDS